MVAQIATVLEVLQLGAEMLLGHLKLMYLHEEELLINDNKMSQISIQHPKQHRTGYG